MLQYINELEGCDKQKIACKTENIYNTTVEILEKVKSECVTINHTALNITKNRIEKRKKENSNYIQLKIILFLRRERKYLSPLKFKSSLKYA
jgi:hypothetical protein